MPTHYFYITFYNYCITLCRVEAGGETFGERGWPQARRLQQIGHRHFLQFQGRKVWKLKIQTKCQNFNLFPSVQVTALLFWVRTMCLKRWPWKSRRCLKRCKIIPQSWNYYNKNLNISVVCIERANVRVLVWPNAVGRSAAHPAAAPRDPAGLQAGVWQNTSQFHR